MIDDNECGQELEEIEQATGAISANVKRLLDLSRHNHSEVRLRALEALCDVRASDVESRIREAISDPDELVRTAVIEILMVWKNPSTIDEISRTLSDASSLVRSAAAIAAAELGAMSAVEKIEDILQNSDEEEKVALHYALYRLGKAEFLQPFLNGLFNGNYRIRCATANLLHDVVTPHNREFILHLLQVVLKDEETVAARSSLERALNDMPAD